MKTRNSIWRALVALSAAALLAVFVPTSAGAQGQGAQHCAVDIENYEGTAIITINPLSVQPGGAVTITGAGFPPNSVVPLTFNGDVFAEPVADGLGSFTLTFTVPSNIPPGIVTFEALCGAFTLSANLTVVTGGGNVGPLPTTGADHTTEFLQIAAVLLICGALLVFLSRRQSRRRELTSSLSAR